MTTNDPGVEKTPTNSGNDSENEDATETEWKAVPMPDDEVCMQLLAEAATYEIGDDMVEVDTGGLIDTSCLYLATLIRSGSATANYHGDQIVVSTGKDHHFVSGHGSVTVTVKADRQTHRIVNIKVGAFLY